MLSQHLDGLLQLLVTGLFHPENNHGVRCVSVRYFRRKTTENFCIPTTRFIPPEEFPLPAAVPHHCGRYLHAVTSHTTFAHLPKQMNKTSHSKCLEASKAPDCCSPSQQVASVQQIFRFNRPKTVLPSCSPRCLAAAIHPMILQKLESFRIPAPKAHAHLAISAD